MKKRVLSALLATAMLVTSVPAAFAAKKTQTSSGNSNIYAEIGSFEKVQQLKKLHSNEKVSYSLVDGGSDGGKCIKATITQDWGGLHFNMPFVVGEKYDISFDIKTEDAPAKMSLIYYYKDISYAFITPDGQFTNEWTRYSVTWECTGVAYNGQKTENGAGTLNLRYGSGQDLKSYLVDNVSVVPHGRVPDADYSSLLVPDEEIEGVPAPIETEMVEFSDMKNHWAKDTVNLLASNGYIQGMGNNIYSPNTNVTRAQFVKMMVDSLKMMLPKEDSPYVDIKGDEWFAPTVSLAAKLGLVDPAMTFGNKFLPDQAITREEAATIATKMAKKLNGTKKTSGVSFTDDGAISKWAKEGVKDAAEYGLIKGYETGAYKPKANITRAEAATILRRVAEMSTIFAVYVDADNGNDKNDGSAAAPLKTIYEARDRVRKASDNMQNDVYVYIRGRHYLDKTFELTEKDSGKNGYRIIYTSWGDEKPTLSMGKKYTGFELYDSKKNIYRTYVGAGTQSRQAYFNDVRGIRARTITGFTNPQFPADPTHLTYIVENPEILTYKYPLEIEGVWHSEWRHTRIIFESVKDLEDGTIEIRMTQPFKSYVSYQWDYISDFRRFPTYLENAIEFLDSPSEWYLDHHEGYLYYIPRESEDMSTMVATLPKGESMMEVKGASYENPVRNITFDNIEFADTGYMRTTTNGGSNVMQNYTFTEPGKPDGWMPLHAILIQNSSYIDFTNNRLTRMGSSGLLTSQAIQHCNFIGNEFFDISGNGMNLGNPTYGGYGGADPVNPADPREFNQYNRVENNFFYGIGLEYESAAALGIGWARHTTVSHNYFGTASYSGIHQGWGWKDYEKSGTATYDLEISHNYFSEQNNGRIYDGASVYTLGATSLESAATRNNRITGNYIENSRNAYGGIYPDEGSTNWHIYNNVIDFHDVQNWRWNFADKAVRPKEEIYWGMIHTTSIKNNLVENNYTTHQQFLNRAVDSSIVRDNPYHPDADWPEEAREIIKNAYIEEEYLDNFPRKDGPLSFVSRERQYEVPLGEKVPLDVKIYGNYMKEYDITDFDVDFWISDPSILKVDKTGMMEATGTGEVWLIANANINGFLQVKEYKVYVGEKVERLSTNLSVLNMLEGFTTDIKVSAETTFGKNLELEGNNVSYTSADESIATVDANGNVTAVGRGKTTIRVVAEDSGLKMDKEIPVSVITYSQENSLDYPYSNAPSDMFEQTNWKGTTKKAGSKLSATGSPNYYTKTVLDNQLIAFDMSIDENPSTWPSLALCAPDRMSSYANDDCYLIGFKPTFIEVQRFNKGVRTMIFGEDSLNPVGGPGIPNPEEKPIYQYGSDKTMSVIVGALKAPEGTRLVLTINGVNIFDYLDNDDNALTPTGFFGIYNTGTFTFSPYTGRKAK